MAALSVFHGGFTRSAAQRVAAVSLPLLSTLADKSLLGTDEVGRFAMHPLIRTHAEKALAEDDARRTSVQDRHADFFAHHLAALTRHAIGDQRLLQAGVTAEYANCRVAWRHAVGARRADLIYDMARTFWSFFEGKGRFVEGIALLSPALALPKEHPAAPRALTRLRNALAILHHRKGDGALALSLARSGIAPGEDCGDTEAYVGCLLATGICLWDAGRGEEGVASYRKALQVAMERQDRHCVMWAKGNLGMCLDSLGRRDEARVLLEEALAEARELGDVFNTAIHLNNLGLLLCGLGQQAEALALLEECVVLCRSFALVTPGDIAQANAAVLLFRLGRLDEARLRLEKILEQSRRTGAVPTECRVLLHLARIDLARSDRTAAWGRLREALCLVRGRAGLEPDAAVVVEIYGDLIAASGDTSQAAAAWRASLATSVLDDLARQRISDKFAASKQGAANAADGAAPPSLEELLDRIERGPGEPLA
jgi:tetratricopeptide (TPR) repeat protein